uniref:Uncharacterized protein n=1 Tax=Nelumbo nucifera TaxID=4432 RepID=A0A822XVI5_NELNU|nr:TPA_asm: hypothetical protein HUJ06_026994 [Nelumbo nucifera]DAD25592.1 TPA_asm: hypothetical protein HUJ06_027056 [Nelumbo nucifera]DAD25644.1 TPA_asm: hypothetical protein HUJ06_027108 [Nelumbo nucifera]
MVKVACFQATALDAHVVVVVGPECLCSILYYTTSDEWGITSLFDLQNKAYELSVLWQRSLHTKEPNHNGSKPSFSFQLVRFPGVAGPDYMGTDPSSSESRLFTISTDELSRELFLLGNISKSSGQQE